MKKDKVLRDADRERRDHCREALDYLAEKGLPEWAGFSNPNTPHTNVLLVRGGSGQVHVGDVFRTVFPTLDYLRARNMKIVLASSPGLELAFKGWEDTLKILDASQEPDVLVKQFEAEGVEAAHDVLLRQPRGKLQQTRLNVLVRTHDCFLLFFIKDFQLRALQMLPDQQDRCPPR